MTDSDPITPFGILDFVERIEAPKISKYQEGLGDAPAVHRWRAQWNAFDGQMRGIELVAYPVVKVTPCGAWIDPHAWREWRTDGEAWHLTGDRRWVSNDGGAAWAKPTQEAALFSIAVRLDRWAIKLYADVVKIKDAARVLKELRPQNAWLARRVDELFK